MIRNNRKCIVTNKTYDPSQLIRIVKQRDGTILVDSAAPGRGAYVLNSQVIVKDLMHRKALNRAFKLNVAQNIYDELIKVIISKGGGNNE